MPTYDYECEACGHTFEQFQSITAPAIRKCPVCAKLRVRRLIGTGGGLIFRGSGFYQTDYRSDGYAKAAKAEKEGSGSAATGEGGSSKNGGGTGSAKSEPAASTIATSGQGSGGTGSGQKD